MSRRAGARSALNWPSCTSTSAPRCTRSAGRTRRSRRIAQAVRPRPDLVVAHDNLGNALAACGRIDEAVTRSYSKALGLAPSHLPACATTSRSRSSEQAASTTRSTPIATVLAACAVPDVAPASCISTWATPCASRAGRVDEAIAAFRRALALQPARRRRRCVGSATRCALRASRSTTRSSCLAGGARRSSPADARLLAQQPRQRARPARRRRRRDPALSRRAAARGQPGDPRQSRPLARARRRRKPGDAGIARHARDARHPRVVDTAGGPGGLGRGRPSPRRRRRACPAPIRCCWPCSRRRRCARRRSSDAHRAAPRRAARRRGPPRGRSGRRRCARARRRARPAVLPQRVCLRGGRRGATATRRALAARLDAALAGLDSVPVSWACRGRAPYRALGTLGCVPPRSRAGSWPVPIAALVAQQIAEPMEEARDAASISRFTAPVAREVSVRVRRQYEDHPYPRLEHARARDDGAVVHGLAAASLSAGGPRERWRRRARGPHRRLWHGPGIDRARTNVSRRRGARHRPQRREPRLCSAPGARARPSNLAYAQADLLGVERLGRQFDVVSCGACCITWPIPSRASRRW